MSQGSQGNKSGEGDFGAIVMAFALVLAGLWVIWQVYQEYIIAFSIEIRKPLLFLISKVNGNAGVMLEAIERQPLDQIDFQMYSTMLARTGGYVRWVYLPLIVGIGIYVYFNSFSSRFRKRHTIKSLVSQEKAVWPEISPVSNIDLIDAATYSGKWGFALSEREFVRAKGLLDDKGELNREKAARIFAAQLGAPWRGVEHLRPHAKVLFAIFAMRIGGDATGGIARAREVAKACENEPYRFEFDWVDQEIQKHINNELVKKAISRHFYEATVLCTMLQLARVDGVFASSLWIWLKPTDRNLFYALNCVGRYADFIEVGGITSHWKAEKKFGMAIPRPQVESAINGTITALKDYCDDDFLEKIFK